MSTASASPARSFTPPQIARRYGVATAKVIAWIKAGELSALNLASTGCTRPRYRVTTSALEAFERGRTVLPTAPATRKLRRRGSCDTKDFFPD